MSAPDGAVEPTGAIRSAGSPGSMRRMTKHRTLPPPGPHRRRDVHPRVV